MKPIITLIGIVTMLPLSAVAQNRMQGYDLPARPPAAVPAPAPSPAPVRPAPAPAPAPAPQPAPRPAPAPHTYPNPEPGPNDRVRVVPDSSYQYGHINGWYGYIQDNGQYGTDRMLITGPAGEEHIVVNCNVSQTWQSWGPNSHQFVEDITDRWCDW